MIIDKEFDANSPMFFQFPNEPHFKVLDTNTLSGLKAVSEVDCQ